MMDSLDDLPPSSKKNNRDKVGQRETRRLEGRYEQWRNRNNGSVGIKKLGEKEQRVNGGGRGYRTWVTYRGKWVSVLATNGNAFST